MPRITTPTNLPLRRDEETPPIRARPVAPDIWAIMQNDQPKVFLRVARSLIDGGIERITVIHPGQRASDGGGETTDVLEIARIAQRAFPGAQVSLMGLDPSDATRNSISELERALGGFTEDGNFRLRDRQGRLVIDGRHDVNNAADLERQMNSIAEGFLRAQDVVITGGAPNARQLNAVATEGRGVPRGLANIFVRELNAPLRWTRTPAGTFMTGENNELMRQLQPGVRSGSYGDPALRARSAELLGENALPARAALLEQMFGSAALAERLAGDRWGTAYLPNMPDQSFGFSQTVDAYLRAVAARANTGEDRHGTVFVFSDHSYEALKKAIESQGFAVDDLRKGTPTNLPERNGVRFVILPRQTPEAFRGTLAGSELPSLVTGTNSFLEAVHSGRPFLYHSMMFKIELIQEYVEVAREALERAGVPEHRIQRFVEMYPRLDTQAERAWIDERFASSKAGFESWVAKQGAQLQMPTSLEKFPYFYTENTRRIREAQGEPMTGAEVDTLLRESLVRLRHGANVEYPNPASAEATFGADPAETARMFEIVSEAVSERSFERELTQTVMQDFRTAKLIQMLQSMPAAERAQWMELFSSAEIPGAQTFAEALRTGATHAQIRDAALLYDRPEFRDAVQARLSARPTLGQAARVAGPQIGAGMLSLFAAETALDLAGVKDRGARFLGAFPLAYLAHRGIDRFGRQLAERYNVLGMGERAAVSSLAATERAAVTTRLGNARVFAGGLTVALAQGTFSNAVATGVMNQLGIDPRSLGYRATSFASIFAPDVARAGLATLAPQSAAARVAGVAGRAAFWIGLLKLADDVGGIAWDWSSRTAAYDRMVGERARELKSEALKRDSNIAVRGLINAADFLANTFGRNSTAAFQRQQWRDVAATEIQTDARNAELEVSRAIVQMMAEVGASGNTSPLVELKKRIGENEQIKEVIEFLRITTPSGHGSVLPEIFGATIDDAKLEQYLRGLRGRPPRAEQVQAAMAELSRIEREVRAKLPGLPANIDPEDAAVRLEAGGTAEGRALAGELRTAVMRAAALSLGYERAVAVDATFPEVGASNVLPIDNSTRVTPNGLVKPLGKLTLSEVIDGITKTIAGNGPTPRVSIGWINNNDRTQGVSVRINRMTFVFKHQNGEWVVQSAGGRRTVLKDEEVNGRPAVELQPIPPGANLRELIGEELEAQQAMDAWREAQRAAAAAKDEQKAAEDAKKAEQRALAEARSERTSLVNNIRRLQERERELTTGGRAAPAGLLELIARNQRELAELEARIVRMEERASGEAAPAAAAAEPALEMPKPIEKEPAEEPTDPHVQEVKDTLDKAEKALDALREELRALEENDGSAEDIEKKKREIAAAVLAVDQAAEAWNAVIDRAVEEQPAEEQSAEPPSAPQLETPAATQPVELAVTTQPVAPQPVAPQPVEVQTVPSEASILDQLNQALAARIAASAPVAAAVAEPVAVNAPAAAAAEIQRSYELALPSLSVRPGVGALPNIEASRQAAQQIYLNQFVQNRNLQAARTGVAPASTAGVVATTYGVLA
jgi:hypothetical protein